MHPLNTTRSLKIYGRRLRPILLVAGLTFLSLACRLSDVAITPAGTAVSPTSSNTGASSSSTPDPSQAALPGSSRANPIARGQTAVAGQFTLTVLDSLRGDAAWQEIHLANANNTPPPEGMEYLLVNLRVSNTSNSPDEGYLGLHVTGDGRVVHFSFDSGVVPPAPALDSELVGGTESSGWAAYLIREGEGNLMLVVEDYANYDTPATYLAIDEGAALTVDRQTMLNYTPTDLGVERAQPDRKSVV